MLANPGHAKSINAGRGQQGSIANRSIVVLLADDDSARTPYEAGHTNGEVFSIA